MFDRKSKLVPVAIAIAICAATAGAAYMPSGPSSASQRQSVLRAMPAPTSPTSTTPMPAPTNVPSTSSPIRDQAGCPVTYDERTTFRQGITIVEPYAQGCLDRWMTQRPTVTIDPDGIVDLDGVCQAVFESDLYRSMGAIRLTSYISNLCQKIKDDSPEACLVDAQRLVNNYQAVPFGKSFSRDRLIQVCTATGSYQGLDSFFDE